MREHAGPVEKKTAKGVKRKVKDDHLHFAHYLDTLRSFKSYVCKQNLISSTSHTVRAVHTRKVDLRAFDTKRWLCEDTVHTHSHGHRDTVPLSTLIIQVSRKCYSTIWVKYVRFSLGSSILDFHWVFLLRLVDHKFKFCCEF